MDNMKDHLFVQERRNKIAELIKKQDKVSVLELSEYFHVTGSTIRSDLKYLEEEGLLMRTYGGAIRLDSKVMSEDIPKNRMNSEEKLAIAQKAVTLVDDFDAIAIDTGTTCDAFAHELIRSEKKGLTILTYDLKIAMRISSQTDYRVQVLGGLIRNGYPYVSSGSIVGEIRNFSVDKAFLATTAFDIDFGFSTPNFETAEIKKSLINISKCRIFMCDHTKVNEKTFSSFAKAKDCEYFIIDKQIRDFDLKPLRDMGVQILIAD